MVLYSQQEGCVRQLGIQNIVLVFFNSGLVDQGFVVLWQSRILKYDFLHFVVLVHVFITEFTVAVEHQVVCRLWVCYGQGIFSISFNHVLILACQHFLLCFFLRQTVLHPPMLLLPHFVIVLNNFTKILIFIRFEVCHIGSECYVWHLLCRILEILQCRKEVSLYYLLKIFQMLILLNDVHKDLSLLLLHNIIMHILAVNPFDLFLAHLYFVLLLQLLFHWNTYDCGYGTNYWTLAIYIIFYLRLIIVQLVRLSVYHKQRSEELLREDRQGMHEQQMNIKYGPSLPVSPLAIKIFKHTSQMLLLGISIFLIVEMAQHPQQFSPPICQSRAILIVNISGALLACLISVIEVILSC